MKFDMMLVHAPSVYDFRKRDDVLFAYISNSDSVHVSSIFEMPPVGIFGIKQYLNRCGFNVEFFNVASKMVADGDFDVEEFFRHAEADYIGIDLHWLVHCHGALALTELYKEIHPNAKTVLGGIASTYYHEDLINYPQIDYVVRGYDTLEPIEALLKAKREPEALAQVANLTWKHDGEIHVNELTYAPLVYTAAVDWTEVFADREGMTPYNLVIPQAGCEYNCRWCGGSRYFFQKYMGLTKGRVQKSPELLKTELESIAASATDNHTITMIDFWHEYPELFSVAEDIFMGDSVGSVHFSLHRLPKVEKGRAMAAPANAVIELSPDSHEMKVAKASGRGFYTMDEMEAFMDALIDDVYSFEIYFMLGLPEQDEKSVWGTVDYCEHILKKYKGKKVFPFICPMLPFLDPGSEIYDYPEKWGYSIRHHTVEDHRQALLSMNWRDRLNYETKWLSRDQLVNISYDSVRALAELKAKYGQIPKAVGGRVVSLIDATRELLAEIDAYQAMPEGELKETVGIDIKQRIAAYNKEMFTSVRSQQRPLDLGFTKKQWFDTDEAFDSVMSIAAAD